MTAINGFVFAFILVWVLKAVIAFFLGSLLLLFVALGIHKVAVQKSDKRGRRKRKLYEAELARSGAQDRRLPPPENLEDAINLASALATLSAGASPPERLAMRRAVPRTQVVAMLENALRDRNWGNRFRALTAFYDLGSPAQFKMLLDFAEHEKNTRVYGNALMACAASISSFKDLDSLLALMQESIEISASYYEGILRTALRAVARQTGRERTVEHIRSVLLDYSSSATIKASLVHAVAKEQLTELKQTILDLAYREANTAITIAVLRALRIFNQYDAIIRTNLGNPIRSLNIVALRASQTCAEPDRGLIDKIVEQLGSGDYAVRRTAAISLRSLGEQGRAALIRASQGDDKYAGDISTYVLSLESNHA